MGRRECDDCERNKRARIVADITAVQCSGGDIRIKQSTIRRGETPTGRDVDDESAITIRDPIFGRLCAGGGAGRRRRLVGVGARSSTRAGQGWGEVLADHSCRADGIPDLSVVGPVDRTPDLHGRLWPCSRLHPGALASVGREADRRKRHLLADDEEPWLQVTRNSP